VTTMNDNKGSIIGTVLTTIFAWLAKIAANFESHAQAYASLAAVVVAIATLANIFFGPFSPRRKKQIIKDTYESND